MVKAGNGQAVGREMTSIPRGEIPADQLSRIANLAWRINRPRIGLRLLYPELRRQGNLRTNSHPEAFSEYAACLVEVGALAEAAQILREVEPHSLKSKFYLALLLFKQWNYEAACPLLEEYLAKIPTDYHQIVVRVNLAAAYVVTRKWEKAETLLRDLEIELRAKNHLLLLGNCYEIWSQIYFYQKDYDKALHLLGLSEDLLAKTRNMGWLYTQKWIYLNKRYAQAASSPSSEPILNSKEIEATALEMGSWETIRELQLHNSLLDKDASLFNTVYFGSPLPAYRERLQEILIEHGSPFAIAEQFTIGPSTGKSPVLEKSLQETLNDFGPLAPTFLEKKLLHALLSDLFAPARTGQLFSMLFDGDFFDLETSPDRVFQVIGRLRIWLKENWGMCRIEDSPHGYRIILDPSLGLKIDRSLVEQSSFAKADLHSAKVRSLFGEKLFSARELQEEMGGSVRSANRLIKTLLENGELKSEGKGRYIRFKVA